MKRGTQLIITSTKSFWAILDILYTVWPHLPFTSCQNRKLKFHMTNLHALILHEYQQKVQVNDLTVSTAQEVKNPAHNIDLIFNYAVT